MDATGKLRSSAAESILEGACLSLAVFDQGNATALLAGTTSGPVVLSLGSGGRLVPKVFGSFSADTTAMPGPCAIADFGGDAVPDILQPHSRGLALYKGQASGGFAAAAAACGFALGEGLTAINVIAYDGPRCLGAQAMAVGSPGFFARRNKGPLKLQWRTAGGTEQTKNVMMLRPTRLPLPNEPGS